MIGGEIEKQICLRADSGLAHYEDRRVITGAMARQLGKEIPAIT